MGMAAASQEAEKLLKDISEIVQIWFKSRTWVSVFIAQMREEEIALVGRVRASPFLRDGETHGWPELKGEHD